MGELYTAKSHDYLLQYQKVSILSMYRDDVDRESMDLTQLMLAFGGRSRDKHKLYKRGRWADKLRGSRCGDYAAYVHNS